MLKHWLTGFFGVALAFRESLSSSSGRGSFGMSLVEMAWIKFGFGSALRSGRRDFRATLLRDPHYVLLTLSCELGVWFASRDGMG